VSAAAQGPRRRGPRTLGYVVRRLGWALTLVLGVTTVSFVVANLLPGDPARMLVGPQASARELARARELYALDRPLPLQYVRYWTRLLHFGPPRPEGSARPDPEHRSCAVPGLGLHVDLGFSFHYRRPVVDLLVAKIPRSVELALAALTLQVLLGVGIGVFAASRRGTRWDEAAIGVTLLGVSAPTFLLGLFFQYLLAYKLGLLPYDGYGATPGEHLRSLVLPALTLGIFGTALYARIVRDELGTALAQDYVRTARAKGASPARVLVVHALRNALVPVVTLVALDLGTLVSGAIVTEKLFRWPGVGEMAVVALQNRDGPLIAGTVLFAAVAVVLSTLLLDLAYVVLDPRMRGAR
jgi:peptide/nickel transport system permease protein